MQVLISGFTATPTPSSRWRRRTHSTTASGLILSARQVSCHGVSDRHLQKLKTELFGPLAAVFALFCPIHIDLYGPFRFGHIQNCKTLRNVVSFRLPCVSEGYTPPPPKLLLNKDRSFLFLRMQYNRSFLDILYWLLLPCPTLETCT